MRSKNAWLLVLAAFVWGISFVTATTGGDAIGALSFNGIRMLIGALALSPVITVADRQHPEKKMDAKERKNLLVGGTICGIVLFAASTIQQYGITLGTEAGKAGFLTAFYIILVPIVSIFLKKRCGLNVWIGVVIALVGLYLLCIKEGFSMRGSDVLVLVCALIFSIHILVIDHYSLMVDGIRLSQLQFLVCGLISLPFMVIFEVVPTGAGAWLSCFGSWDAWIALLYSGVMSSGVGYTLQILGQKGVNPTLASMLMSLESVFSVLAGWVLLGQQLSFKEIMGCVLIFAAILLAQAPVKTKE